MADLGNSRIVRMNDMTQAGWTTLGTPVPPRLTSLKIPVHRSTPSGIIPGNATTGRSTFGALIERERLSG